MRPVFILFALGACATQGRFAEKFVDDYCTEYLYCDSSGRPCPVRISDEAIAYSACNYDRVLAKECLEGPFTCNDSVEGFEVIEVPAACYDVCGVVQ